MTTVAMKRGWKYGSHRDFIITARRLVEESGNNEIGKGFEAARQFHANFYQSFLDDGAIAEARPQVHQFVLLILAFVDINTDD